MSQPSPACQWHGSSRQLAGSTARRRGAWAVSLDPDAEICFSALSGQPRSPLSRTLMRPRSRPHKEPQEAVCGRLVCVLASTGFEGRLPDPFCIICVLLWPEDNKDVPLLGQTSPDFGGPE